ncbi:MAG: IS1182 family transposase [Theionarchaea archaeon]|nr:IS1182 family transposase [Theionarchaea archaeon]
MNEKDFETNEGQISKFIPYDQHQELLLPKSVQDYVPENHIARAVSRIIDYMSIAVIVMSYDHKGAPAYHPRMMLKVLVYAYLTGIRSSRRIAALLKDSLVFMYLSGRQTPDFRTICRFRREHADKIEEIFQQVVDLCEGLDMVGLKNVFSDGSKVKANASVKNSKTKEKIEKEIEELKKEVKTILKEAEEIDRREDALYGDKNPYTGEGKVSPLLKKIEKLAKLEKLHEMVEEKEKINTTDSDANIMQFSDKTKKPAYNGQIAVDGKENVIVACRLTDEATDHYQLKPLAEATKENVGTPQNWGADAGVFSYENAEYLDKEGITGYIPDNFLRVEEKKKNKKFRKSQFEYNEEKDSYTCPAQKELPFSHIQKRKEKPDVRVYKGLHCPDCLSKEKCTKAKFRTISRDPREHYLESMRQRLKTEKGKQMKKQRSTTVEPTFGNMKHNKKFTHFLLRGAEKAGIEFTLTCIAINIEKIHTYITTHQIDLNSALQAIT